MCMYVYIYIYIYIYIVIYTYTAGDRGFCRSGFRVHSWLRRLAVALGAPAIFLGIHYRGVQWEGAAVDGGSII